MVDVDPYRGAELNIQAFKAAAEARVALMDAQGRLLNSQLDAALKAVQVAKGMTEVAKAKLELRAIRIKAIQVDKRRRRVENELVVVDRQLHNLQRGLYPTEDASLRALSEAAYKFFYRRATPTAQVQADNAGSRPAAVSILAADAEGQLTSLEEALREAIEEGHADRRTKSVSADAD